MHLIQLSDGMEFDGLSNSIAATPCTSLIIYIGRNKLSDILMILFSFLCILMILNQMHF
jgi:hypothetical protein